MSILGYAKDIYNNPEKYTKFLVALGGFALSVFTTYFPDAQWLTPLVAFLTAVGVFQLPNVNVRR